MILAKAVDDYLHLIGVYSLDTFTELVTHNQTGAVYRIQVDEIYTDKLPSQQQLLAVAVDGSYYEWIEVKYFRYPLTAL